VGHIEAADKSEAAACGLATCLVENDYRAETLRQWHIIAIFNGHHADVYAGDDGVHDRAIEVLEKAGYRYHHQKGEKVVLVAVIVSLNGEPEFLTDRKEAMAIPGMAEVLAEESKRAGGDRMIFEAEYRPTQPIPLKVSRRDMVIEGKAPRIYGMQARPTWEDEEQEDD
jgi:hypothetical protein